MRTGSRSDTRWRLTPLAAAVIAAGVVLGVGLAGPALAGPEGSGATPTTEATTDPDNSSPAAGEPVITAVTEGDMTLTVTWTAPDIGAPTGYTVWIGGDVPDPACDELQPPVLQCTVTGLENEVSYAVEVAANHGSGEPTFSQAWWATPHTTTVTPPGAPTLNDIAVSGDRLTLTWSEPADGGAAIIGYKITATRPAQGGGTEPVTCEQPAGRTSTTCTITAMSGVEYTAAVSAWNTAGEGTASAVKTATAAPAPTIPATAPEPTPEPEPGETITISGSGGLAVTGAPIVAIVLTGILLIAGGAASRFAGRLPHRPGGDLHL